MVRDRRLRYYPGQRRSRQVGDRRGWQQEISPEINTGKSGMILGQSGTEELTGAGLNSDRR